MRRRKFIGNLSLAVVAFGAAPFKSIASAYSTGEELAVLPHVRHGLMQFSGIAKSGSESTRFFKNGYPDNKKSNIIVQLSFGVHEEFGTYNFQISIEENSICFLGPMGFEEIEVPLTGKTLFADDEILLELRRASQSEKLMYENEGIIDYRAVSINKLEEVNFNFHHRNEKKQAHPNDDLLLFILRRNMA